MRQDRAALHEQHQHELLTARQRVESAHGSMIGWMLRFAERDLDALTPSEWMVVAYEVASIGLYPTANVWDVPKNPYPVLPVIPSAAAWSVEAIPGKSATAATTLPSRDEGRRLQHTMTHSIDEILTNGWTRMKFSDIAFEVYTYSDGAELVVHTKHVHQDIEYRFMCLLAEHAAYIRRCQECKRLFLAVRRDQLFCDGRCQARVASRKYRQARAPKGGTRQSKQSGRVRQRRSRHLPAKGATHDEQ